MVSVRLPKGEWQYDPGAPLGPVGGFGQVFEGIGPDGEPVAVKRLTAGLEGGGHREIDLAECLAGRELHHVVPVFDAGVDAESGVCFVAMARAGGSLQARLDGGQRFQAGAAAQVLSQILSGLEEVEDIVHRDLKPANVLMHEGSWKIADFGIARFAEATTSDRTLKHWMSPPYAAPEQWRHETCTPATDLYALGCIGYALLTGRPPYVGTLDEVRDAHLHASPPPLQDIPDLLVALLHRLMVKPQESRPPRDQVTSVLKRLAAAGVSPEGARADLARAGAVCAQEEAQAEAARLSEAQRTELLAAGLEALRQVVPSVLRAIADATLGALSDRRSVKLGRGRLAFTIESTATPVAPGLFPMWKWDVVAWARVSVTQDRPAYEWSASLWYARPAGRSEYRWWEVSYFRSAYSRQRLRDEPFSLPPGRDADLAVAPIMHVYEVASGPDAVDDENMNEFTERWLRLLTQAAGGNLGRPSSLPLPKRRRER